MSQDNIFREIDEELRSDRMRTLWRRFAPFVIGGAVAIVALVAVNEGWSWYSNSQSSTASQELYSALDAAQAGDLAKAKTELDTITTGSGGYATLAKFREAALLEEQGDSAGAVAAYDALASDQSNVQLRELALLLAANILVDTGTLDDVNSRVASLATDDSRMRRSARELIGLAQFKAGQYDAAKDSFQSILDDPLTQTQVRNRMSFYLADMLSQGNIAPEATAEQAAAAIDAAIQGNSAATPANTVAPSNAAAPANDVAAPANASAPANTVATPANAAAPANATAPANAVAPANAQAPSASQPSAGEPVAE